MSPRTTDLPDGMVSAEAHMKDILYANAMNDPVYVISKRDAQWAAALAGANSMIGIRESELELAQGRAAAAEARIADLKHQLGEYADKLDCMVDPEEHRQKLAAREAECAEERRESEIRGATWATHDHMWPFFAKNVADNYLTREEYEGMVAKAATRIVDERRKGERT